MKKSALAAIVGMLLVTIYSKGDAGQTFVYNCSNYTLHKPFIRRSPNWWDSLDLCKQNGGALVSIENQEELNFLREKLSTSNYEIEYFIGLRNVGGEWRWIGNNSTVVAPRKYPWDRAQPSGNGNCTKMYFSYRYGQLRYDDIPCGKPIRNYIGLICERPVDCRVETGQTFVYNCSNYTVHNQPIRKKLNWLESLDLCKHNGSALVSIEDQEELNFLTEKLSTNNLKIEYFIGLWKLSGEWRWINNNSSVAAPHKFPWVPRQPSGNGNCTKMYFRDNGELQYDDIPCGMPMYTGLICERPVNCGVEKGEEEKQHKGPTTRKLTFTTTQTLPATEASLSTISTQQESARAALPETPIDDDSASKADKDNSQLIAITLTALAVVVMVILILVCFCFVRRPRTKASNSKTQPDKNTQHQESSTQIAMHANLKPSEEGLETYETVNEDIQEHVEKSNRKRSSASKKESSLQPQELTIKQTQSKDGYLDELPDQNRLGDSNSSLANPANTRRHHGTCVETRRKHKTQKDKRDGDMYIEGGYAMLSPQGRIPEGGFYELLAAYERDNREGGAIIETPTYANLPPTTEYINV